MIAESKKNKKPLRFNDVVYSVLLGLLIVALLAFLVITNIKIKQRRERLQNELENLKKEIKTLEEKNSKLQENISQANTKEYLEKIAREQFNLKAPGEEVVVISKETTKKETQEEVPPPPKKSPWNPLNWWALITSNF